MKPKLKFIALLSVMTAAFAIVGLVPAAAEDAPTVGIGYRMNFASLSAFSSEWMADALESDMLTISPEMPRALGPGEQNVTAKGTGYVVYRIAAGKGRSFEQLGLELTGRIFHLAEGGHYANDGCKMEIKAKTTGGYVCVFEEPADDASGELKNISVDLTAQAAGESSVDVRIEMTGDSWNWVGISSLAVTGKESLGADESAVRFLTEPANPEIAVVGQMHELLPYEIVNANGAETIVTVMKNGGAVAATKDGFIPQSPGLYTVEIALYRDGESVASVSYNVWARSSSAPDGIEEQNYTNPENYVGNRALIDGKIRLSGDAAYMNGLDFDRHIKLRFDVDGSGGDTFEIAFCSTAGVADFDKKKSPGLYFTFSREGEKLAFSASFADGATTTLLGIQPEGFDRPFAGAHAVEVRKYFGDSNYTDGTEMYVDGYRFSDWLGYSAVKLSKITAPDNAVYMSVRASAGVTVVKLVNVDNTFPILNLEGFPSSGTVGEEIVLPAAKAVDEVDGEVELKVFYRDPYGDEGVVENNAITPLYEGSYEITYSAKDFSGNELLRRRDILVSAKEGMPVMRFIAEPNENGRQGAEYSVPTPTIINAEQSALEISVLSPTGEQVELDGNGCFVPDMIGTYTIIYTAANDVGIAHTRYLVYVKRDVDAAESYEKVMDAGEWVGEEMRQTDDGVMFWGNAYCTRPFEMSNGIEITLDLTALYNKNQIDCWLSLSLLKFPGYSNYAQNSAVGLYFMFFNQDGTIGFNALTRNSQGNVITVVGGTAIGAVDTVVVRVEKYSGDPNYYNNIAIYINDVKNENFSIFDVAYSDVVDNENFTYLSVGAYGSSGSMADEQLRAGTVKKVYFADHTPPAVTMDGTLVSSARLGQTVAVPSIILTDNVDKEFYSLIRMYDPEGKRVEFAGGTFVAEKAGKYTLVVKARDSSGNSVIWIKQIRVDAEEKSGGCRGSCGAVLAAWPAMFIAERKRKLW